MLDMYYRLIFDVRCIPGAAKVNWSRRLSSQCNNAKPIGSLTERDQDVANVKHTVEAATFLLSLSDWCHLMISPVRPSTLSPVTAFLGKWACPQSFWHLSQSIPSGCSTRKAVRVQESQKTCFENLLAASNIFLEMRTKSQAPLAQAGWSSQPNSRVQIVCVQRLHRVLVHLLESLRDMPRVFNPGGAAQLVHLTQSGCSGVVDAESEAAQGHGSLQGADFCMEELSL